MGEVKVDGFCAAHMSCPMAFIGLPFGARIKSGMKSSYTIWKNRPEAAVELYIGLPKSDAKRIFDSLQEKKLEIEQSFGDRLIWDRLADQKASRIRYLLQGGGLDEERKWPMIQEEMISAMEKLAGVLQSFL